MTPQTTQYTPQTTQYTPQTTQYTPQTTQYTPQTTQYTPQTTRLPCHADSPPRCRCMAGGTLATARWGWGRATSTIGPCCWKPCCPTPVWPCTADSTTLWPSRLTAGNSSLHHRCLRIITFSHGCNDNNNEDLYSPVSPTTAGAQKDTIKTSKHPTSKDALTLKDIPRALCI